MPTSERTRAYLRVAEVAIELGVSAATVRRKVRDGELPAAQLGGPGSSVRIPPPRPRRLAVVRQGGKDPCQGLAAGHRSPTTLFYRAWDAAAIAPDMAVVRVGMRLRGDDPRVRAAAWLFLDEAEAEDAELHRHRKRAYAEAEADARAASQPEPPVRVIEAARDEDCVIATSDVGAVQGGPNASRTADKRGRATSAWRHPT